MIMGEMIISSLEYPEKISLVIFTGGCNLRCPYCHNPELVEGGKIVEIAEVINKIEDSLNFIDSVVITGGEPLMQVEEVKLILQHSKKRDLKTKLDTNGCYPERLDEILEFLDYVSLDVKAPFHKYTEITGSSIGGEVKKSMETCLKTDVYLECRTTYVPYFMELEDVLQIVKNIDADLYTLQQFRDKTVLDKKLQGTPVPSRDELKKIALTIKPFQKKVKIKTAQFGEEIVGG